MPEEFLIVHGGPRIGANHREKKDKKCSLKAQRFFNGGEGGASFSNRA
jgi:hypothetical protein